MMSELRDGSCYPKALAAVSVAIACVYCVIAVVAISQRKAKNRVGSDILSWRAVCNVYLNFTNSLTNISSHSGLAERILVSTGACFREEIRRGIGRMIENMLFGLIDGICFPKVLVYILVTVACIDGVFAFVAFVQLMRIHLRNTQIGWTRQKVFHLLIGFSNAGYFLYFVLTLVAACKSWSCWSQSCGFIVMACPKILFLAAFLLLLSFWVDLCHQSNDDDDDEEGSSPREALLQKTNISSGQRYRKCFTYLGIRVGSRQKLVILVTLIFFVLMITSAVLIWIGMGKNPIDSVFVARMYVDVFAIAMLFLGGALTCYGCILSFKMRKVRSDRASSEMLKIAGLTVVSVLCFMSSALVALFTDIPMLYRWHQQRVNGVYTSLLLILYYFMGSSVPSAFVLWVMRELPPAVVKQEVRTIAFITDTREIHPQLQRWTAAPSQQNQVSRASPI